MDNLPIPRQLNQDHICRTLRACDDILHNQSVILDWDIHPENGLHLHGHHDTQHLQRNPGTKEHSQQQNTTRPLLLQNIKQQSD